MVFAIFRIIDIIKIVRLTRQRITTHYRSYCITDNLRKIENIIRRESVTVLYCTRAEYNGGAHMDFYWWSFFFFLRLKLFQLHKSILNSEPRNDILKKLAPVILCKRDAVILSYVLAYRFAFNAISIHMSNVYDFSNLRYITLCEISK